MDAIAEKLQDVIPAIVHYSQNAYVKGTSTFDAVRAIDHILEFTVREKIQGLMVATNCKKEFDSVNGNDLHISQILSISLSKTILPHYTKNMQL